MERAIERHTDSRNQPGRTSAKGRIRTHESEMFRVNDKDTAINLPVLDKQEENSGDQFWRSYDQLANSPRYRDIVDHEFQEGADTPPTEVDRRNFMKVMGASFALAGISACVRQPEEKIIPYVKQPEEVVPGKPLFYATALTHGGFANGVIVESHEGRPTRVDGNIMHPANLGSSDVFMQAEILQLYDPDRSKTVTQNAAIGSWEAFTTVIGDQLAASGDGKGLRLLTGATSSPTLIQQINDFLAKYPQAQWHTYEPTPIASGEKIAQYDFSKADVIVVLDCDLFTNLPGSLRYARDFASRRNPETNDEKMNRLYVAEAAPTGTGSIADHRMAVRSTDIWKIASAIAKGVGGDGSASGQVPETAANTVEAIIDDLKKHNGKAVVVAGETQPHAVHKIVESINNAIGAVGSTVEYIDSPLAYKGDPFKSLRELTVDIKNEEVETLIVIGCNPVYDAPVDLDFVEAFKTVPNRVHHGLYHDETAYYSQFHVPATHPFEGWSDGVAYDGTVSIVQPLIAPLYGPCRSSHQMIAFLNGNSTAKDYDLIQTYWSDKLPGDFEKSWRKALHDGILKDFSVSVAETALPPTPVSGETDEDEVSTPTQPEETESGERSDGLPEELAGLEVNFRADPCIWDGRYSNNGWLQECPKPITKLVWDNAVLMSKKTADDNSLENGDVVELELNGRTVQGPVWIMPGHAERSVTVHFGYGRERTGRVGKGAGFNAYALRESGTPWFSIGMKLNHTRHHHQLVSTQDHSSLEGRNYYRDVQLSQFLNNPEVIEEMEHVHTDKLSFYRSSKWDYSKGYAWAMTIDLSACIGCNACLIACQSENNIPVVGKGQVAVGRELHWIRIDRYFKGDPDDPNPPIVHQPVPCQQCEQAPCEVVCPVAATVHSAEGLNDMVYNRCIGTRYCSNNCPYKVRRFNFLQYADEDTEQFRLMRNPDVSVRTRGVMEKCTYCVQRINSARIKAKIENRSIQDGEIITACQHACPTQAIVFGDQNDKESRVSKMKESKRNYGMLNELNTIPRTTYLARLTNPQESLVEVHDHQDEHH